MPHSETKGENISYRKMLLFYSHSFRTLPKRFAVFRKGENERKLQSEDLEVGVQ
jgi:hypothetical protein